MIYVGSSFCCITYSWRKISTDAQHPHNYPHGRSSPKTPTESIPTPPMLFYALCRGPNHFLQGINPNSRKVQLWFSLIKPVYKNPLSQFRQFRLHRKTVSTKRRCVVIRLLCVLRMSGSENHTAGVQQYVSERV